MLTKSIDNIKLKHLDKMERTGKVRQFLKWYVFIPVFMIKKTLLSFISEIYIIVNDGKNEYDIDLESLEWKVRSVLKIQEIESNYLMVVKDYELSTQFDYILKKFKLNRQQRRKIKPIDLKQLGNAIQRLKILTGIEIKDYESIIAVQNELILLKDKYKQRFGEQIKQPDEPVKKIGVLEYAGSYLLYSGGTFTGLSEMTIPEFIAMKNNANAKYEAERKPININDNGIE